ncbi:glutathione-regulated potassium-efflux system protein KefB, partial [Acinetobacter baumannii]
VLTQAILEPVTLIVTLSMVLTPVIYWIMATQVIPLFNKERPPEYDEIPQQDNPIIIAGFGRFGQIIARIARLQHLGFT